MTASSTVWKSPSAQRRVLLVAGTGTSLIRLMAVLPMFERDPRVQVVVTQEENSRSTLVDGVPDLLRAFQVPTIPWPDATRREFDLVLTANEKDRVHDINGPAVLLPHGCGFQKTYPAFMAEPGIAGLTPAYLQHHGCLVHEVIGLSHPGQRDLVAAVCPAALDRTVVIGDPCAQLLRAHRGDRDHYRAALGLAEGQRLVVCTSTWGPHSLLGRDPDLPEALCTALGEDYRVALLTHPGVIAAHGHRQVRAWLHAAIDNGLITCPPHARWEPVLLAADCVIADQASMSLYAAALDLPLLTVGNTGPTVLPDSPAARLAARLPRLDPGDPDLRSRVEHALTHHTPGAHTDIIEGTVDDPDLTAARLRAVLYTVLRLAEPPTPATLGPLPPPITD